MDIDHLVNCLREDAPFGPGVLTILCRDLIASLPGPQEWFEKLSHHALAESMGHLREGNLNTEEERAAIALQIVAMIGVRFQRGEWASAKELNTLRSALYALEVERTRIAKYAVADPAERMRKANKASAAIRAKEGVTLPPVKVRDAYDLVCAKYPSVPGRHLLKRVLKELETAGYRPHRSTVAKSLRAQGLMPPAKGRKTLRAG